MIRNALPSFPYTGTPNLSKYRRVKMDAAFLTLEYAGAGDVELGTLNTNIIPANGENGGSITPRTAAGTRFMVADGAIAAGAGYGPGADGKISTGGTDGIVLTAAAADGDIIEVLPTTAN